MTGPRELATRIGQLNDRLDTLAAEGVQAVSFGSLGIDALFARAETAVVVLAGEATGTDASDLAAVIRALEGLRASLESVPERCSPDLVGALAHLADFLESRLTDLDDGGSPADVLTHAGWRVVASRCDRVGTPLSVMDALEESLDVWSRRWSGPDLDPGYRERLDGMWRDLRARGDGLFARGVLEVFGNPPGKIG